MERKDLIFEKCGRANVVFTSRLGGVSESPYDYLNVGVHVGDDFENVRQNRELIHQEFKEFDLPKMEEWIFLNQTHCDKIFDVDSQSYDQLNPPEADASITTEINKVLISMIADCGPLILSCGDILATVHASVKTISLGLIEKTVKEIRTMDSSDSIHGILGPCIHPENYEYSKDDLARYVQNLGKHVESKTHEGKPAFNLPAAIKFECEKFGVNFRDINIDTFSNENYFSYRRDGVTGRQCVLAWK